jgi:hypothetical protein
MEKDITVPEFKKMLESATIIATSNVSDTVAIESKDPDENGVYGADKYETQGYIRNTLTIDGLLEIAYHNSYSHPKGNPSDADFGENVPELFVLNEKNITIVDDDGDEISKNDFLDIIKQNTAITNFNHTDLSSDEGA